MGVFKFEDDPLKHYVRTEVWLPTCRKRLRQVRAKAGHPSKARRLRYFTFCAVGAIDVLMLDVANIIRRSSNKEFDTVVFFDRGDLEVLETLKRIPGAYGYPGDFVKIVLLEDPDEEAAVDAMESLAAPPEEPDRAETRERQRRIALRHRLIQEFPFDVINLDLEGYFFAPGDPFPGRLIRSLRKMLEWQKIPINNGAPAGERLDGFSLMFTTQIGPPNLTDDYLTMLRNAIGSGLVRWPPDRRCVVRNRKAISGRPIPYAPRCAGRKTTKPTTRRPRTGCRSCRCGCHCVPTNGARYFRAPRGERHGGDPRSTLAPGKPRKNLCPSSKVLPRSGGRHRRIGSRPDAAPSFLKIFHLPRNPFKHLHLQLFLDRDRGWRGLRALR